MSRKCPWVPFDVILFRLCSCNTLGLFSSYTLLRWFTIYVYVPLMTEAISYSTCTDEKHVIWRGADAPKTLEWMTGSEMQVLPSRFLLKFLGGLKLKGELSCQSENLGTWRGMEGGAKNFSNWLDGVDLVWEPWWSAAVPSLGLFQRQDLFRFLGLEAYSLWVLLPTAKKILCAGEHGLIPCANGVLWTLVFPVGALISLLPWGAGGLHSSSSSAQLASSSHLPPELLMGLPWISTWGPAGPGVACWAGAQSSLGVYCLPSPQASRGLASRRLTHLLWCQLGSSLSIFCLLGNHFRGYLFSFA